MLRIYSPDQLTSSPTPNKQAEMLLSPEYWINRRVETAGRATLHMRPFHSHVKVLYEHESKFISPNSDFGDLPALPDSPLSLSPPDTPSVPNPDRARWPPLPKEAHTTLVLPHKNLRVTTTSNEVLFVSGNPLFG